MYSAVESGGDVAKGSQVELRLNCTGGWAPPTTGKIGIRTLQTADGKAYTEIGYDFDKNVFYADHSSCCSKPNAIVQRAPLSVEQLGKQGHSMTVLVDGGLIEAFLSGKVITPLVAPDADQGAPEDRISSIVNSAAGVTCGLESWTLAY